jgi:hypothetical protein
MAWTSVMLKKLSDAQETMQERFPKLDVAGSTPVSRSNFSITYSLSLVPEHH